MGISKSFERERCNLKKFKFEEYFKRQIELWGEGKQKELQHKRVLIVGSGGLGTSLGLALGESGIGYIDLVDFDRVNFSNIHRQIAFTLDTVGKFKSEMLLKEIKKRNPFVKLEHFKTDFKEFTLGKGRKRYYDLILDATDNFKVRVEIDNWSKKIKTPWIYGSVEEFNGQVCFFDKASFSTFIFKEHTPKGISAPMVMQIASFQANLALRYLTDLTIKKDFSTTCIIIWTEILLFRSSKCLLSRSL